MINKEEFLKYIDESLADLKDEQWYNEYLYKAGDNPYWVSKDKAKITDVMDNWWGYKFLILQLEKLKKRVLKEDFNYSCTKREYDKGED